MVPCFVKKYFNTKDVIRSVDELWNSINFEAAIVNSSKGQILLSMSDDGSGVPRLLKSTYNEYMIVAWLAKNSTMDKNSESHNLWYNHYESISNLPSSVYNEIPGLTDSPGAFLSSFMHLFKFYLCQHFSISDNYLIALENSQMADELWRTNFPREAFEWGLGAGSAITTGYHADAKNNNPDRIISPPIVGGYLPIFRKHSN